MSPLCEPCSLVLPSLRLRSCLLWIREVSPFLWVRGGEGGLPPLSSPMAASANSVGVLVFRAGDDRCRGLIGSSNVICGVFNCGVPLHCTKRATVIELTGYIFREYPKSGAYLSPNLCFLSLSWRL